MKLNPSIALETFYKMAFRLNVIAWIIRPQIQQKTTAFNVSVGWANSSRFGGQSFNLIQLDLKDF